MRTEFPFTLPRGYVDSSGNVHRGGCDAPGHGARRDRAASLCGGSSRTRRTCPCSFSRVSLTRLGEIPDVTPDVVESLFAADFDHLQRLYERLNTDGESVGAVTCPSCAQAFEVDLTEIEDRRLGE